MEPGFDWQKKKLEEKLHRQERKLVDADNTNSGGQWGGKNEPHSSRKSRAKALTSHTGMVNSPTRHTRYVSALLLCTQYGLKRSDDKNHTVRTCPMAAVKCPPVQYFLDEDLQKNTLKLVGAWKSAHVTRALPECQ